MTDSEEVEERVAALINLLKSKDDKKIKECGEEIADAASDNEPCFEPEDMVGMLSTWLDACIAKRDDEVLDVTAKALRWSKVDADSEHPGMVEVMKKLTKALNAPGSQHLESMFLVRSTPVKWTGDPKMYPVLAELFMHDKAEVIHDALNLISGNAGFYQLTELPDEEVAEIFKMTVAFAKHVQQVAKAYKPGEMTASGRLAQKMSYLNNLFQGAYVFCQFLVMNPNFPKASAVIAVPTLVMDLKDIFSAMKPKPKEQDLKEQLKQIVESCQNLITSMPKPAAKSADPAADAASYIKALKAAGDSNSLNGAMKMMISSSDSKFLDVILAKDSLQALAATFKKVKKTEFDDAYRTLSELLIFVVENRPAALDPVADDLVQIWMAGPVAFMSPKRVVDVLIEKSPATAKKIWSKYDVWAKVLKDAKAGPSFEGALYQVANAMESLPKVLEGSELEAFCKKVTELADSGKGTTMEGSMKCSALLGLKSVVVKDKARLSSQVLQWVKDLKEGDGSSRDMAISLLDTYEGRSLEGAYEQIADMNSRFKEACGDMESLKKYVDDNVSELKDFISTVAKKLPMPVRFSSEPRYVVKKAILLHFECQAPIATRFCVLPQKATFTTETMEWSRWLKMGLSAAKLGKSILSADAIADAPGVVEQVKGLFSLYKKDDGEDFLTFISEPFLTSQEQDKLLNQLRAANFFNNFRYDSQTATWLCANCHAIYTKAGSNRSATGLEEAAAHPDLEIPFPDMRFEQEGGGLEGLQDRASNMKEAALEVKKTTTACCSLFGISLCETETGDEIKT